MTKPLSAEQRLGWRKESSSQRGAPAVERLLDGRIVALLDALEEAEAALAEVRRYAELTLDSISVERSGMAQDVLDILDGGE